MNEAAAAATQAVPPAAALPHDGKLRVLVTDHPVDISTSSGVARAGAAGNRNGAAVVAASAGTTQHQTEDPRTIEIQADIVKFCAANVLVTNDPDRADFVLVFRRREGARSTGFAGAGLVGLAAMSGAKVDNIALFDRTGDMVFATKQRTVEKSVQEICAHVK